MALVDADDAAEATDGDLVAAAPAELTKPSEQASRGIEAQPHARAAAHTSARDERKAEAAPKTVGRRDSAGVNADSASLERSEVVAETTAQIMATTDDRLCAKVPEDTSTFVSFVGVSDSTVGTESQAKPAESGDAADIDPVSEAESNSRVPSATEPGVIAAATRSSSLSVSVTEDEQASEARIAASAAGGISAEASEVESDTAPPHACAHTTF